MGLEGGCGQPLILPLRGGPLCGRVGPSPTTVYEKRSASADLSGGEWGSNPRPSVPQTDALTN